MNKPPLTESKHPRIAQGKPSRKWVLPIIACLTLGIAAFLAFDVTQDEENPAGDGAPKFPRSASAIAKQKERDALRPRSSKRMALGADEPRVDPWQLIETLSQIEPGSLTQEKAEELQQGTLALVGQGRASVLPLQEFFQKNIDRKFAAGSANLPVEPTLRIAFMKVLSDLPTPDNVDLQEELLRTTSDPAEVTLLARQLQAQEPGKHRESIIRAARVTLDQARAGQWPGHDTKELTDILKLHDGGTGL